LIIGRHSMAAAYSLAFGEGQRVHPTVNFSFGRHQLGVLFAQGEHTVTAAL
jgi:hypothetical protein